MLGESAPHPPYRDLTGLVRKTSDLPFGTGGFSDVYMGIYQDGSGQALSVVIKVIRGIGMNDADMKDKLLKRLKRETRVWHTIKHPNILEFLGVVLNMGQFPALVSPYCAKGNMIQHLEDHPESNRLHLILDVAKAIEYLHEKNVIHGDFKGANVLIADDCRPLVSDFGRSKIIDERGFTSSKASGSVRFLAPELIADPDESGGVESFILTKECDVYAFSMVGVEILSGQQPYPKLKNENRITLGVPKGLRPNKKEYELSGPHAKIWHILELCWVHIPADRLPMSIVVQQLSDVG